MGIDPTYLRRMYRLLTCICQKRISETLTVLPMHSCQKRIYIPLPDEKARKRMFEIHVSKISPPPEITAENFEVTYI